MTSTSTPAAAHPRSRGEHASTVNVEPRAVRLIPARAGNIFHSYRSFSKISAHPRSRGEHTREFTNSFAIFGSSPLARGTSGAIDQAKDLCRLIPARAGNMVVTMCQSLPGAAHPRSRGEHREPAAGVVPYPGSSPLARGTYHLCWRDRHFWRLIPARAGNITVRRYSAPRCAAHPRSRGEHLATTFGVRTVWRLIPARAGNI